MINNKARDLFQNLENVMGTQRIWNHFKGIIPASREDDATPNFSRPKIGDKTLCIQLQKFSHGLHWSNNC